MSASFLSPPASGSHVVSSGIAERCEYSLCGLSWLRVDCDLMADKKNGNWATLSLVETRGLIGMIEAADAMVEPQTSCSSAGEVVRDS